jgi:hypothetical protein
MNKLNLQRPLPVRDMAAGIFGGIAGACVGYYLFRLLATQGFYALVLPGALAGIGCGTLSRHRSILLGVISAIIGLFAGVYSEWQQYPFLQDDSFGYFMMHLHQLRPFTQLLIAAGGILAFWFGMGRTGGAWIKPNAPESN